MPTTELDSFKWIGHSSPKQWQQVSADQSSGRPCRSDEPQAALSVRVEHVVLHDTKSIRALENSEMGSLSSDTWFGVRTSRRWLNLESWRYLSLSRHVHPSIIIFFSFHHLLWRLLSFKTLPLTSICGRHGGMINGKKTSSILYVIQVPTEKVRQYNLYKVVLSVLQSISTLMRFYQNHSPRRALQKCAINDFHTIKILHVRFCVFFVVSAYAVDIDAADAGVDGAGAVIHADTMTATDVVFIWSLAIAPP